jgi:hypothetical protein
LHDDPIAPLLVAKTSEAEKTRLVSSDRLVNGMGERHFQCRPQYEIAAIEIAIGARVAMMA